MVYVPELKSAVLFDFTIPPYVVQSVGRRITEIFFSGAYNGGLQAKITIYDTDAQRWEAFMRNVWFPKSLREDIKVNFRIYYESGEYPKSSTRYIEMSLYKVNLRARGSVGGVLVDFYAMNTADKDLSYGYSSGKAYKGRISDVLKQVIAEHTTIPVKVTPTLDNKENYWYMLRQRPPRFIRQLLEFGTSFTKSKTQMVYGVWQYGPQEKIPPLISITPQGEIKPKNLGKYTNANINLIYSIHNEDYIAYMNKLTSSGISTLTGDYLDVKADPKEIYVFAKDSNTSTKILAGYPKPHGHSKQNDTVGFLKGMSNIKTPPELYNDGSVGYLYKDYVKNRSMNMYLNHCHNLVHARIEFPGIGLLDNTIGLGTDTIYVEYTRPSKEGTQPADKVLDSPEGIDEKHFWTGNWTLMAFEHRWNIDDKSWNTILDCSRFTTDTNAIRFSSKD